MAKQAVERSKQASLYYLSRAVAELWICQNTTWFLSAVASPRWLVCILSRCRSLSLPSFPASHRYHEQQYQWRCGTPQYAVFGRLLSSCPTRFDRGKLRLRESECKWDDCGSIIPSCLRVVGWIQPNDPMILGVAAQPISCITSPLLHHGRSFSTTKLEP